MLNKLTFEYRKQGGAPMQWWRVQMKSVCTAIRHDMTYQIRQQCRSHAKWTNLRIPHSSNIICIKWKSLLDTAKYIYYKKDKKDRGHHALARAVMVTEVRKIRWMYICRILKRCSVDRMIRGTSSFIRTAKTTGEWSWWLIAPCIHKVTARQCDFPLYNDMIFNCTTAWCPTVQWL